MHTTQKMDFCLLIPCYNNFEGLVNSLDSVEYDRDRFMVLVVDDGSKVVVSKEKIPERIKQRMNVEVVRLDRNSGITKALNEGLRWIRGNIDCDHVARLDCGDTCSADRFLQQIEYMKKNPNIVLLGSWCVFKADKTGENFNYRTPVSNKLIRRAMHFRNVFIHPTVMMKLSAVTKAGDYPENFPHAEDYALFWELMQIGEVEIINRYLVTTEINRGGISVRNRGKQLFSRNKVVMHYSPCIFLKMLSFINIVVRFLIPYNVFLRLKKLFG